MTSYELNHLPETPLPNIKILRIKASTYEFGGSQTLWPNGNDPQTIAIKNKNKLY